MLIIALPGISLTLAVSAVAGAVMSGVGYRLGWWHHTNYRIADLRMAVLGWMYVPIHASGA